MKKLLIITNLFWVCVIVLPSFVQPGNTNPANTSSYHLIDASLAKMMAENYRNFYVNTFLKKMPTVMDQANGTRNNNDSRSVWFSIKKLKDYIRDMEASSLSCSTQDSLSGLRFYFIRYPERDLKKADNAWNQYGYFSKTNMPKDYANRHSLMIVPTRYDKSADLDIDYDPRFCTAGKFDNLSIVMKRLISLEKSENTLNRVNAGSDLAKSSFITSDDSDAGSVAVNRGSIIPPPYQQGGSSLRFNVPCSGASLMNFVDGYDNCGQQVIIINKSTTPAKTTVEPKN
jgi:hypothetical protein